MEKPETAEEKKERMPFVQQIRDKIQEAGGQFTITPEEEFDQIAVLEQVRDYLMGTLQLEQLTFADVAAVTDGTYGGDANAVAGGGTTPADIAKFCSPGAPLIVYDFLVEKWRIKAKEIDKKKKELYFYHYIAATDLENQPILKSKKFFTKPPKRKTILFFLWKFFAFLRTTNFPKKKIGNFSLFYFW